VAPDNDVVALVGGDLAARARVGDAAARVGLELVTTTPMGLPGVLQGGRVQLVIIDLDNASPDSLDVVAESEPSTARVVGFYSHVDLELGQRARAAGIEAFPRGRFWRELSGMVARDAPVSLREGEPQRGERGEGRMSKDPRPAAPSQPEEGGFEEGAERAPDSPEEASEGRYSTGLEDRPEDPDKARKARFSEGEEDLPDTPDKGAERRFSEGQEQDPKN
jgi:hypothetical protein